MQFWVVEKSSFSSKNIRPFGAEKNILGKIVNKLKFRASIIIFVRNLQ